MHADPDILQGHSITNLILCVSIFKRGYRESCFHFTMTIRWQRVEVGEHFLNALFSSYVTFCKQKLLSLFGSVTVLVMNVAKDPELTALSKLLDTVNFSIPTGEPHIAEVASLFQSRRSFRYCYPGLGGGWAVRISMNGSQRLIATSGLCAHAIRFADMATFRFWKYRRNYLRSPIDTDFNLGLASAKFESESDSSASHILTAIETHCRAKEYLSFPIDATTKKLRPRKQWLMAWEKFKRCSREISSTCSLLDPVGIYSQTLDESLETFETSLDTVDKFLRNNKIN